MATLILIILIVCSWPGITEAACSGGMYTLVQQIGASGGSTPLEGYWLCNETGTLTSGTITDYSGTGTADNGTYASASVATASGIVADNSGNAAVSFTGAVATTATLGTIPSAIKIAITNFTSVVWYRSSGLSGNAVVRILSFENGSTAGGWELDMNGASVWDGFFRTQLGTGTYQSVCANWALIGDGNIHMVAVGMNGTTGYCSVDAATYTTTTGLTAMATPPGLVTIGNSSSSTANNSAAPGTYQDFGIFSGQLTQANLTSLYNCGHAGTCPSSNTQNGMVIIGQ